MKFTTFLIRLIKLILPEDQPEEQVRKYFVKGFSGMLIMQAFAMLLTFAGTWLLTRLLGKSGFGTYSYLFAIFNIAGSLATFGYRSLIVRETAAYMKRKETAKIKGLKNWSIRIIMLGASVAYGVSVLLILRSGIFESEILSVKIVLIAALSVPMLAFTQLFQSLLSGLKYVLSGNISLFVIKPLALLAGLGIIYLFQTSIGLENAILANTLSFGTALLVAASLFKYKTSGLLRGLTPLKENRMWMHSGFYFWMLSLVTIINGQADLLILGALKPMAEVGVYKISLKLAEIIPLVLFLTNTVLAPVYARLFESAQKNSLQHIVNRSSVVFILATLPLAIVLVFAGKPLMHLFGIGFESGYPALLILVFGQLLNVLMGSVGLLLKMTRNENVLLYTFLGTAVLNITLDFLLIPSMGIEGAAIANASSIICWNVVMSRMLFLKTGIKSSVILSKLSSLF